MLAGASTERLHIILQGVVQGVGFPPTIYGIAQKLHLAGWVRNAGTGIEIEVEGGSEKLKTFLSLLKSEQPRAAVVAREQVSRITPLRGTWFEILPAELRKKMTGRWPSRLASFFKVLSDRGRERVKVSRYVVCTLEVEACA